MMARTRDVMVHDYPRIEHAILWDSIKADLPPLVVPLKKLLEPG